MDESRPVRLPSTTTWKMLGRDTNCHTWLALEPLTERTHQLPVQCAEMGFTIVSGEPRPHLHPREGVVPISKNKPPVTVTALA